MLANGRFTATRDILKKEYKRERRSDGEEKAKYGYPDPPVKIDAERRDVVISGMGEGTEHALKGGKWRYAG